MLLNHTGLIHAASSSIWAGCSSGSFVSEIVRLSGARVADDGLHLNLFAPQKQFALFLQYVQQNSRLTFLCSSIFTFETLQVKGHFVGHRSCTPEEVESQRNYLLGFSKNVISVGVKNGNVFNDYLEEPLIAIMMKGEEVYDQTPRSGAGKKIS